MRRVLLILIVISSQSSQAVTQRGAAILPNPSLTPGATAVATRDDVCGSEYKSADRNIPITLKRQTFDRYGLSPQAVGYNVDHLIPVRLGGSNSPKNLWPQALSGEWNYHMKNRLERRLHKMVCTKTLELEIAQQEIARDWVSAFKKYLAEAEPR